jgi:hypothetical protein
MFSIAASTLRRTAVATTNSISSQHRFFHVSSAALAKLNLLGLAQKVDLAGQNVLVRVDLNVPLAKASSPHSIKLKRHAAFWEGGDILVVDNVKNQHSLDHFSHLFLPVLTGEIPW